MIKTYLKTAIRSLGKHKIFTFINIIGLSIGITCCLLIWTYVSHELSYEKGFSDRDRIFRVISKATAGSQVETLSVTSNKIAPLLTEKFPEVDLATRFVNLGGYQPSIVKYKEKVFQETQMASADSTFLEIFPLEFIAGDAQTPLSTPKSIIISEQLASKYFGETNPVGEVLTLDNRRQMTVKAVFKNLPSTSHFNFESLISFHTYSSFVQESWFPMNYTTYVKINDTKQANELSYKLSDQVGQELSALGGASGFTLDFELQPISEIYYTPGIRGDTGARMSKQNIYAIAFIGLFVLIIACINYINLTTAKSERRAKEVGIRKVLGARKQQLISQFYCETLLITVLSVVLGIALSQSLMPYFNELTDKSLVLTFGPQMVGFLILTIVVITLISGFYPAIYLSSFAPIKVLKSTFRTTGSSQLFRKLLVVVQFAITTFLILGTLVIYKQLKFTNEKELGFESEQTILIPVIDAKAKNKINILKSELQKNANVSRTSFASEAIGSVIAGYTAHGEGMEPDATTGCFGLIVDPDFIGTLGIELVSGNNFRSEALEDTTYTYVINEKLAKEIGWQNEEAINKSFRAYDGMEGKVIGVVKDFHYNSLKDNIEPLAMWVRKDQKSFLYVKINTSQHNETLAYIEDQWKSINPDSPFEFSFLDDMIQTLYASEQRTAKILSLMTILSVIVGSLGLFGLTAFIVERRTKEIGIRKVLGATVNQIMLALSSEFLILVGISFALSFPLAFFFLDGWLQDYAYRINIGWTPFVLAGGLAALLAFMTVSFQTLRAALANPVESLKEE